MTIKILLSGAGLIGSRHAHLVNQHPECCLSGIVTPDTSKHAELKTQYGADLYSNFEDAIKQNNFNAAIISSPNEFHYEQALACLDRGIPVLVEKPLTSRLDEARMLVKKVNTSGIPVLVGHHRTYNPLLNSAKEFIRSDRFGQLVFAQGSALFYKPTDYFQAGIWRTQKGGGPILINLIHEIGILRELCGEIKKVFAFSSSAVRKFEVEDTVSIAIEFTNGALGGFALSDTAASNKSWEMTSGENPAYPFHQGESCYHFAGTRGSLDFPGMNIRTYSDMPVASWWAPFHNEKLVVTAIDPLKAQLDHFVEVVQGKATPKVPAASGCQNMIVLEAISLSIEKKKAIDVEIMTDDPAST